MSVEGVFMFQFSFCFCCARELQEVHSDKNLF